MKRGIIFTLMTVLLFSVCISSVEASESSIVNPRQVYSYQIMKSDIDKLAKKYPDLITYKVIGTSPYKRDIYAISLGKGKSTVTINGAHHAREWITSNLNMYMIETYAKAYESNSSIGEYNVKEILDNTTIWFVPMVNPDGVTLQQFGVYVFPQNVQKSLIKMNEGKADFKRWKADAQGIDLNRQYSSNWNNIVANAVSPRWSMHKGTKPFQTNETIAMKNFTYEIDPEIAVAYHSSGELLYWHYYQQGERLARDKKIAEEIANITGYELLKPKTSYSGGGYTDWFIETIKRPGFTPEVAPWFPDTNVPVQVFDQIWAKNKTIGLYIASEGYKLYSKKNPESTFLESNPIDTWNTSKENLDLLPYSILN